MDTTDNSNVTDDQELAKVLEDMNQQAVGLPPAPADDAPHDDTATDAPAPAEENDGMSFEEAPVPTVQTADEPAATTEVPAVPSTFDTPAVVPATATPSANPELDAIKKTALEELRPLIDKLDLAPQEKFDTLLLLLRSTDDKTLVNAAHEAAKNIPDEAKRAQALLDVIKEIDYFSGHGQAPA